MRIKRNKRLTQALGAAIGSVLAVSPAWVFGEDGAASLDRVQVTGTRLKQVDLEGSAPITLVDRDDLNRVPFDSVGQLLQSLPSMSGSPINTFTNNGGSGAVSINLRGLGAARTLVLINGRRSDWANDLNAIPIAMVERIEILKEGASAVYGADAVAGVVNVITRSDFDGMEVTAQYSSWQKANEPTLRFSAVTGGSSNRGNFMLGMDYVDQPGIFQAQLNEPWMLAPLTIFDADGFRRNGVVTSGPNQNAIVLGSSSIPGGRFGTSSGVMTLDYTYNGTGEDPNTGENRTYHYDSTTHTGVYRPYGAGGVNDSYNYNPVNYMQTPNKRISFFTQGLFEINSNVNAFFEGQFQRRESTQILAPLPYFSDSGDPGFTDPVTGVNGVSGDNFYNPFGETVSVRRRVVETGGRNFTQAQDAYRILAGIHGRLGTTWEYEVSYNYSETLRADTDYGQFHGDRLALALGPSFEDADGSIVCGTPGNVIAGCVPVNMFGGPGTITQEMLDYVGVALNDRLDTRTEVVNGVIHGDLFGMSGGWAQGAFGIERRRERALFEPDSGKATDAVTGNAGEGTFGSKEINSVFTEFAFPLLSGVTAARSLDLNLGARHDRFNTFGSATSAQIGLKWKPSEDLMVRATKGTSFREPTIFNLYAGQSDAFPTAIDPCGQQTWGSLTSAQQAVCDAQGVPSGGWNDVGIIQLRGRVGGNPDVGPEEGESFTLGFGWSPTALPGFSVVLDYWDFEVTGTIGALSVQTILNGCILEGVAEYCDNINRHGNGSIDTVVATSDNLGALKARGIDIELNYFHASRFGDFDHRLMITKLLERAQQERPGADFNDLVGLFDVTYNFDQAYPELKAGYKVDWSRGNWGAAAQVEYIHSIVDDNDHPFGLWVRGDEPLKVPAQWYLDLTGRYHFATDTSLDFGVTNVFDESAPFINSAFNANIDESTYRPLGRGYFFRLTQSF